MSSHSVKLAQTLRHVENLRTALRSTAHESEYQRGLYNGCEMFRAMLTNMDPQLIENRVLPRKEIVTKEPETNESFSRRYNATIIGKSRHYSLEGTLVDPNRDPNLANRLEL